MPRPVVVGDRSQEKKTTFDGVATDWKVVPPQPSAALKSARPVPLFADSRIEKFAAILNRRIVAPNVPDAPFYLGFDVGVGDSATRFVERCDVASGTGKIVGVSAPAFRLTDVSPDGKFALGISAAKNKFGLATPTLLTILPLERFDESETLEPAAVFYPFFDPKAPNFAAPSEILGAFWVDLDNILTTTREEAVLWNLATGRSVYSFSTRNSAVALDRSRSLGALATSEKVVFFAPKTGEILGKLDVSADETSVGKASNELERAAKRAAESAFYPTSVSFSPNGLKIAVATAKTLLVFDAKSGAATGSFALNRTFQSTIDWANDDFLLVGTVLYDVSSGVPLCEYRGAASGTNGLIFANGRVWTICGADGTRSGTLVGFELPHSAALDALKSLDLAKDFALSPGGAIALRFETNGLLDEKTTRQAVEQNVAEQGFKIDPNAAVVLTARCVLLDEEVEADYSVDSSRRLPGLPPLPRLPFARSDGPSLGVVKLKVFSQSFELTSGGKSLWKIENKTTGPQNVEYDSKKTLEQTLLDANKPQVEYYRVAPIPKFVRKSGEFDGAGSAILNAKLTPDGVR